MVARKYDGDERSRRRQSVSASRELLRQDPDRLRASIAKRREYDRSLTAARKADPELMAKYKATNTNAVLRKKYGITLSQRDALLAGQGGSCALCGRALAFGPSGVDAPHVDHCHATGRVRGILCGHCNTALGKLGDTADAIRRVLAYLEP